MCGWQPIQLHDHIEPEVRSCNLKCRKFDSQTLKVTVSARVMTQEVVQSAVFVTFSTGAFTSFNFELCELYTPRIICNLAQLKMQEAPK
jgi:hypothetical protein